MNETWIVQTDYLYSHNATWIPCLLGSGDYWAGRSPNLFCQHRCTQIFELRFCHVSVKCVWFILKLCHIRYVFVYELACCEADCYSLSVCLFFFSHKDTESEIHKTQHDYQGKLSAIKLLEYWTHYSITGLEYFADLLPRTTIYIINKVGH